MISYLWMSNSRLQNNIEVTNWTLRAKIKLYCISLQVFIKLCRVNVTFVAKKKQWLWECSIKSAVILLAFFSPERLWLAWSHPGSFNMIEHLWYWCEIFFPSCSVIELGLAWIPTLNTFPVTSLFIICLHFVRHIFSWPSFPPFNWQGMSNLSLVAARRLGGV